tara:strand:- start:29 stop:1129 length:1101 start_codon:yes stop_codon:yes gene_type:complete
MTCRRDVLPAVTGCTLALSVVETFSVGYNGQASGFVTLAPGEVITRTHSLTHAFTRLLIRAFLGKPFYDSEEDGFVENSSKLLCIGGYRGFTNSLDSEDKVMDYGTFTITSEACCPCAPQFISRPYKSSTGITIHFSGFTPPRADEYLPLSIEMPSYSSGYCRAGVPKQIESDVPTTAASWTISSAVTGDDDHDAEIRIILDQSGPGNGAQLFEWISPDSTSYIFVLSASYTAGTLALDQVDGHSATDAEKENFLITAETNAAGWGCSFRIGFVEIFRRQPVALPAAMPLDAGAGNPGIEIFTPSGTPSDFIQVPFDSALSSNIYTTNVARCLADALEGWEIDLGYYDGAITGYTRTGSLTITFTP